MLQPRTHAWLGHYMIPHVVLHHPRSNAQQRKHPWVRKELRNLSQKEYQLFITGGRSEGGRSEGRAPGPLPRSVH
jgi:hypothetical protein